MDEKLRILMVSTDRNIFDQKSAASERMRDYGSMVGELHIIVFALKSLKLEGIQLAPNVWVYPTNSFSRFLYAEDAASLGSKIIKGRGFVRGHSVITVQNPFECGWAGLKLKKRWRLPLEVQLHTDPFSPYFTGILNNIRKHIAEKVLPNASTVRVVAEALKQAISRYTQAPITVLPIYISKTHIEEVKSSEDPPFDAHGHFGWKFVMLAVSRLAPEKNLAFVLQVLAYLRGKFDNVGLVIVGSGPEEQRLKSLAKKYNIAGAVAFEGWRDDLSSYYASSDLFIQASYYEGYGMAFVEAGLLGLPIVSTPVGVATEFENGKDLYICPVDDLNFWLDAINDLIVYPDNRKKLSANMRLSLENKLLTKEEYLARIKDNWLETAKMVH